MAKEKHVSETPATQFLKKHKVGFTEHPYEYVDHGGAMEAAKQLGLDLHQVAKTLIMEDESAHPLIRSEEHTSELQSLMRNSYAVFCLKKKPINIGTRQLIDYTEHKNKMSINSDHLPLTDSTNSH